MRRRNSHSMPSIWVEGEDMTDFTFCWFADYKDGKMARLKTSVSAIPVNVYAESETDFDLVENDQCTADIIGIGSDVQFYPDEENFNKVNPNLAPVLMIPMGTFSINPDDENFEESPHIIFAGRIIEAEKNPCAEDDEPNCCATIETLEMKVTLFFRTADNIATGGILYGVAWLYGDILKKED